MASGSGTLTDKALKAAKPRERAYRLFDGGGLYIEVAPNATRTSGRYWRFKYRYAGKEKRLALGVYPDVSLTEARSNLDKARALLRDGVDPSTDRKTVRREQRVRAENTFEAVAREWIEVNRDRWIPSHVDNVRRTLEADAFPTLGDRPLAEVTAAEVLDCIKAVERRGALDVASRVAQRCAAVFRHGILTGRCKTNPATELRGSLKRARVKHRAALSREDLPEFLTKLDAYTGRPETKLATRLLLLTFVRTGELRGARWSEVNLDGAEWRIPAERMKMGEPHVVPLSRQAVEALRELHRFTGRGELLFPHVSKPELPMSENTVLYALYRMGYHNRATGHGFRALASTVLNETGWRPDVIERQLAHAERNKVRAAYNRASYMDERRKMMQAWADFIEGEHTGNGKVEPIGRQKRKNAA
jgi:integrase